MVDVVSTRPLLDKLGVKPGARVAVVGVEDERFRALLAERTYDVTDGPPLQGSDVVFLPRALRPTPARSSDEVPSRHAC